ncbi:MAG: Crp/Fnr family transcriptional regulator [Bacteroidales bacterium]
MAKNKNIEFLSPCFRNLPKEEITGLYTHKTQITYLPHETILKQGAFASHVLFVNSGLVRVFLQTGAQKHINIRIARQGDFLAFSSLFNSNVYPYSAVALRESNICMLNKDALRDVFFKNPDFAQEITALNCRNEQRYLDIITNISYKQMRGKLASVLLYLSSEEFEGDHVFESLSRAEIADFATISVESTVKFLKEFEKEQIISLQGKDITILNKSVLQEINQKG